MSSFIYYLPPWASTTDGLKKKWFSSYKYNTHTITRVMFWNMLETSSHHSHNMVTLYRRDIWDTNLIWTNLILQGTLWCLSVISVGYVVFICTKLKFLKWEKGLLVTLFGIAKSVYGSLAKTIKMRAHHLVFPSSIYQLFVTRACACKLYKTNGHNQSCVKVPFNELSSPVVKFESKISRFLLVH